jgi:hypothetical protein
MVSRRAGWMNGWMDGWGYFSGLVQVRVHVRTEFGSSGHTARHGAGVLKVAFLKLTCSTLLRESYILTIYIHGRGVDSQFYKYVRLAWHTIFCKDQ